MTELTLEKAQTAVAAALAFSREHKFSPMAVAVLDARGVLKAYAAEDGTALRRFDIAHGKAYGALAMGVGSKTLGVRAVERPHFIGAVNGAIGGAMIPVAGGVLIRGADKSIIGGPCRLGGGRTDSGPDVTMAGGAETPPAYSFKP